MIDLSVFPEVNPVLRAEQDVAVARVVLGRVEQRLAKLRELQARLTPAPTDVRLPLARTANFERYVANSRSLFSFYRAVFSGVDDGQHVPSLHSEQQLKLARVRFERSLDHEHGSHIDEDLAEVRREWIAAREVDGLAPFALFADRLERELTELAERKVRLERIEADPHIDPLARRHTQLTLATLSTTTTALRADHEHWSGLRDSVKQELRFMFATQGESGADDARQLIDGESVAFARALSAIDGFIERDQLVLDRQGTPNGRSSTERQAGELQELQALAVEASEVVDFGRSIVARLEGRTSVIMRQNRFLARVPGERIVLGDNTNRKTALVVLAHPDDETTAGADMIAQLHEDGYRIVLLTATGGEAGRVQTLAMDTPANHLQLARIRAAEQLKSASALGIDVIIRAGSVDSGWDEPSKHSRRLANNNVRQLQSIIEAALREYQPELVLTHPVLEQQEGYRHNDHQLTHQATLDAARTHLHYAKSHGQSAPQVLAVWVEDSVDGADVFVTTSEVAGKRAQAALGAFESQIPDSAPARNSKPVGRVLAFSDVSPTLERAPSLERALA